MKNFLAGVALAVVVGNFFLPSAMGGISQRQEFQQHVYDLADSALGLGYTAAENGMSLEEAQELLRQAMEKDQGEYLRDSWKALGDEGAVEI